MSESPETTPLSAEDRVRDLLAAGKAFVTARGIARTDAEHALRRAVMATWGWEPDAARATVPAEPPVPAEEWPQYAEAIGAHGLAVPAADEDRERLRDLLLANGARLHEETWHVPDDALDAILRAGVSPSTGDDRLREALVHLATRNHEFSEGCTRCLELRAEVRAALSTGAPDAEEQP